jgi:hypothetical protein
VYYDGVNVRYYVDRALVKTVARSVGTDLHFKSLFYNISPIGITNVEFGSIPNLIGVFTGSLAGTASYAISASYVPLTPSATATSASWASSSLSASVLRVSRSINGIGFDGSSDITIQGTDWSPVFVKVGNPVIGYGKDIFTFVKTSGDGGWNSKVYSKQGYTSSLYASCKCTSINQSRILGLNSNPTDPINDYSDIDYGWYMASDASTAIVRNGSIVGSFGNYTTNSVFDLTYDGVSIKYWFDGVMVTSSLRAIGLPLHLDCFLNTGNGGGITEVKFGSLPYIPTQNGAYDIGSTTKKFNNGYFSGSVSAMTITGSVSASAFTYGGEVTGSTAPLVIDGYIKIIIGGNVRWLPYYV